MMHHYGVYYLQMFRMDFIHLEFIALSGNHTNANPILKKHQTIPFPLSLLLSLFKVMEFPLINDSSLAIGSSCVPSKL